MGGARFNSLPRPNQIAPQDRPKVKAECLRLLATLKLNPARMQLISGFVDTYLKLNKAEKIQFKQELSIFSQPEQESVMKITTSWMEEGIELGVNREKKLIIRQLKRKLGEINPELEAQVKTLNIDDVEELGEALFDFDTIDDLKAWLSNER